MPALIIIVMFIKPHEIIYDFNRNNLEIILDFNRDNRIDIKKI